LSSLADRIRGVLGGTPAVASPAPSAPEAGAQTPSDLSPLAGSWQGSCFVVDREWGPSASHGRERIGAVAEMLHAGVESASLFAGAAVARMPLLFFDLETTGLSGGAGTHAFLVGCGWFDAAKFITRQYVLTRFADERPMLETVAGEIGRAGALVSFNGRSFDAPVLETRFLFHRLTWAADRLPHLDVLHPARQFWKRDECSLLALEQQVIGHRRTGDVPGIEIPARYFQFVRTGNAKPLAPVLQHNRLDLLSLALLTARLLDLGRRGPGAARNAREALALGRVYARTGSDDRACEAFERALALCRAPACAFDAVKIDALRGLAHASRRLRRFDDAARHWRALLDTRGCPEPVAAEATEALAIHAEHRLKDLESAHQFASATLTRSLTSRHTQAVHWRLSRLERKLAGRPAAPAFDFAQDNSHDTAP
jgi:uncharacterized protein YprB with RNaseH-like and TPR domain